VAGVSCIIHPCFSQPVGYQQLSPQELSRSKLRAFWLVVVLSGCLDPFRLSLSTVSAQPTSSHGSDDDRHKEEGNNEIAAAYARYSNRKQNEKSNAQQFDEIHPVAVSNRHFVPPDLHFQDDAVSGRKLSRRGLNALLDAARKGLFKIIYMWDISRLAREMVISLPIVKDLVFNHGIRVISISDGIDTNQPGWEMVLMVNAMVAQEKIKRLIEDVRRGLQNNAKDKYSNGDLCFGYTSVIAPGQENTSRSRKIRPKKVIIIDLVAADWVRRIFFWYVIESRSLYWIAKELNRVNAPRDHRASSSKGWTITCVVHVLENSKVIGLWPYGKRKNKCNPLTGDVSVIFRQEGDPDYYISERPELRIIDDELFYKAQKKREEEKQKFSSMREINGQLRGSSRDLQNPRHMLQGLMRCAKCGRTMQMNGLRGRYLQCSGYPSRQCDAKTSLPRKYAEQQIVNFLKGLLLERQDLRDQLFRAVTQAWHVYQLREPLERKALELRRTDIERRVRSILEYIEEGERDPEFSAQLTMRRREREEIQRQLDSLGKDQHHAKEPRREWIIERLEHMHQMLLGNPSQAGVALRQLLGSITVREVEFPGLKRKKLVGTIKWNLDQLGSAALGRKVSASDAVEEVSLCFGPLPIWAERADEVKALYDQNFSAITIAQKLGFKFGAIAKALEWWFVQHGLSVPTGAEKRARIIRPTPVQDAVLDKVMQLWKDGWRLYDIAKETGCSRNSVTAMIKKWHEQEGRPWLNGQARRKQIRLDREANKDQDAA